MLRNENEINRYAKGGFLLWLNVILGALSIYNLSISGFIKNYQHIPIYKLNVVDLLQIIIFAGLFLFLGVLNFYITFKIGTKIYTETRFYRKSLVVAIITLFCLIISWISF